MSDDEFNSNDEYVGDYGEEMEQDAYDGDEFADDRDYKDEVKAFERANISNPCDEFSSMDNPKYKTGYKELCVKFNINVNMDTTSILSVIDINRIINLITKIKHPGSINVLGFLYGYYLHTLPTKSFNTGITKRYYRYIKTLL